MIDPKNKLDRFLMFLPGFLTWSALLLPVWLGILAPAAATFVLTFLTLYTAYMGTLFCFNIVRGYLKYKSEIAIDWYKKCQELDFRNLPNKDTLPDSLEATKHFLLIPTYMENIKILRETFKSLINQNYPLKNIHIVIGTEEKGEAIINGHLETLKEEFQDKFPIVYRFTHPAGIAGEMTGTASANRRWAASHAVNHLKNMWESDKKNTESFEKGCVRNYIFTTFDADTNLHKEFLARLTYAYLTEPKRYNRFFETAVNLFTNNLFEVPVLSRIESYNITFGVLGNWQLGFSAKETFACYSTALDTLISADYWDVKFIDDTVYYWRAYLARDGDFDGSIFYIPTYADATGGPNYIRAHRNLFNQLVRWGFGSVATVIALKVFISGKAKKRSIESTILWIWNRFERHVIMRTMSVLITFGFAIMTVVNQQLTQTSTVYSLPKVVSFIMTVITVYFIPVTVVRILLYGHPPKTIPLWNRTLFYIESPLMYINFFTFSFIPWLWAETRMMLGELPKTTFYTPKSR